MYICKYKYICICMYIYKYIYICIYIYTGADVNYTDLWSSSALHVAAMHGRPDAVQLICAAGADIDAMDWGGRTPLHLAAEYGRRTHM